MAKLNSYDNILEQAFNEYMKERLESGIYREDSFKTSESFEKKMSKMIKSQHNVYHKVTLTRARKVLCVAIAIIILLLSSLSVGAVRDFIGNFFIKHFATYDTITAMLENTENYPTKLEELYELSSMPDEFELEDSIVVDNMASYFYRIDDKKTLWFDQQTKKSFSISQDNEYSKATYEEYKNQVYYISEMKNEAGRELTIIWDNGKYIFLLSADLPKETMLDLCSSLKIK